MLPHRKICLFVLRGGEGRWRQQCGAGRNGKGRSGGRWCALRNGGAGRRAFLDDLQTLKLTMLLFSKEISVSTWIYFFFTLLCNLFHISQITELHSVCDTWLCSWFLSTHYSGITQCHKSDPETHLQLNVLCLQIREMKIKQLKSSFLL